MFRFPSQHLHFQAIVWEHLKADNDISMMMKSDPARIASFICKTQDSNNVGVINSQDFTSHRSQLTDIVTLLWRQWKHIDIPRLTTAEGCWIITTSRSEFLHEWIIIRLLLYVAEEVPTNWDFLSRYGQWKPLQNTDAHHWKFQIKGVFKRGWLSSG